MCVVECMGEGSTGEWGVGDGCGCAKQHYPPWTPPQAHLVGAQGRPLRVRVKVQGQG